MKFRQIEFKDRGILASEDDIQLLENTLGFRLPEEYKCFLKEIGGGTPTTDYIELDLKGVPPEICELAVASFFPFDYPYVSSPSITGWDPRLRPVYKWWRSYCPDLPRKILPIMRDLGSNLLLLDCRDPGEECELILFCMDVVRGLEDCREVGLFGTNYIFNVTQNLAEILDALE